MDIHTNPLWIENLVRTELSPKSRVIRWTNRSQYLYRFHLAGVCCVDRLFCCGGQRYACVNILSQANAIWQTNTLAHSGMPRISRDMEASLPHSSQTNRFSFSLSLCCPQRYTHTHRVFRNTTVWSAVYVCCIPIYKYLYCEILFFVDVFFALLLLAIRFHVPAPSSSKQKDLNVDLNGR